MMSSFDWKTFLQRWSADMLASSWAEELPEDVRASSWLGFPGATERELEEVETRLKIPLPPSYRSFLHASNGWRRISHAIERLRSTSQINWFREENRDWVRAYTRPSEHGEPEPTPDTEYFSYETPQDFRKQHLRETLQISDVGDAAVFLLNPQVIDRNGEWEAWFLANWLPGVHRYRSFQEMMIAEYSQFCGEEFKQPVGLVGELPDEYTGSPGSAKRKKKARRRPRERTVLGKPLSQWTVEELVEMLKIDEVHVQAEAIEGLERLGNPAAIEPLIALAKDENSYASGRALHAVVKLAPEHSRELMLNAIRNRSFLNFFAAAMHCAELRETRALPLLSAVLRDQDAKAAHLAECVGQSIAQFGKDGLKELIELLSDQSPVVRRRAAVSLMYSNDPDARATVNTLLNDSDAEVRQIAEISLKVLPPSRIVRRDSQPR